LVEELKGKEIKTKAEIDAIIARIVNID